jgi:hypothetical protein
VLHGAVYTVYTATVADTSGQTLLGRLAALPCSPKRRTRCTRSGRVACANGIIPAADAQRTRNVEMSAQSPDGRSPCATCDRRPPAPLRLARLHNRSQAHSPRAPTSSRDGHYIIDVPGLALYRAPRLNACRVPWNATDRAVNARHLQRPCTLIDCLAAPEPCAPWSRCGDGIDALCGEQIGSGADS